MAVTVKVLVLRISHCVFFIFDVSTGYMYATVTPFALKFDIEQYTGGFVGRNSSLGIATRYGLDGPGIMPTAKPR